jgi:hypothetical protein
MFSSIQRVYQTFEKQRRDTAFQFSDTTGPINTVHRECRLGCGIALPVVPEEARKRNKHWYGVLVLPVRLPEIGEKVAFFEPSTNDDPCGPQQVEEESVGREARGGPDKDEHEQIKGMPDVAVRTASHEG